MDPNKQRHNEQTRGKKWSGQKTKNLQESDSEEKSARVTEMGESWGLECRVSARRWGDTFK